MRKKIDDDVAASRASKGGNARSEKLSPDERKAIARKAAKDRWAKAKASTQAAGQINDYPPIVFDPNSSKETVLPLARWPGVLTIGAKEIPCYVLDDGRRIISRNAATGFL